MSQKINTVWITNNFLFTLKWKVCSLRELFGFAKAIIYVTISSSCTCRRFSTGPPFIFAYFWYLYISKLRKLQEPKTSNPLFNQNEHLFMTLKMLIFSSVFIKTFFPLIFWILCTVEVLIPSPFFFSPLYNNHERKKYLEVIIYSTLWVIGQVRHSDGKADSDDNSESNRSWYTFFYLFLFQLEFDLFTLKSL